MNYVNILRTCMWDQATSYKLDEIVKSESLLADGVEILLEKINSEEVWHYGFSVLKSDSKSRHSA